MTEEQEAERMGWNVATYRLHMSKERRKKQETEERQRKAKVMANAAARNQSGAHMTTFHAARTVEQRDDLQRHRKP